MLSQTAEYALRAMFLLASHPEQWITAKDLAEQAQVPVNYLAKVLQQLVKEGLVHGQRGKNGGFRLTFPPEEVNLFMIINCIDPLKTKMFTSCPLKKPLHEHHLCPLHHKLNEALAHIEHAFKSCTLAELLKPRCKSKAWCHKQNKK